MSKARELADLGSVTTRLDEVGNTDGALSNRNLIINGAMQVAQRGTSQSGITSGDNLIVDRFKFKVTSAGTWTQSQDTDVPSLEGFNKSWKAECTVARSSLASSSQLRFLYTPEAQDMSHLMYGTANAKTLTLSFWVKSSLTGTYTVTAECVHTAGRYYSTSYSISTADTWEKKTITISGDTDTGEDYNDDNTGFFALSWWMGAGSSLTGTGHTQNAWGDDADYSELVNGMTVNLADTVGNEFYITGIQLEVGDTATPFEHRSYGDELARCQRYYEVGSTYIARQNNDTLRTETTDCQFSVTKRSAPTMTNTNSNSGNVSVADITASNTNSWRRRHRSASTNDFSNQWNWKADAEL